MVNTTSKSLDRAQWTRLIACTRADNRGPQMSAHKLFCYTPQRNAVVEWMHDIGAVVTSINPSPVTLRQQIAGIEHVNFIIVEGHRSPVPRDLLDALHKGGAIILTVDDHWAREKSHVHAHYSPADGPYARS